MRSSSSLRSLALASAAWLAISALPLSAQVSPVDPFYQSRLDEGKALYLAGQHAAALESLQVASFGFLDFSDKLLECNIYLLLDYHALKNEERAAFYRNEIKRLKLEDKLAGLSLPPAVKARYDEINAAFARMEARSGGRPVNPPAAGDKSPAAQSEKPQPAPAKSTPPAPNAPSKIDVEQAGAFVLQARAEPRLNKKIDLYKKALEFDSSDINIYFEMNEAFYAARKYRDAAELMELLLLYYPNDLRVHIKLAENTLADKAFEKAYRSLVLATRIAPDNLDIRYLLGRANMGLRRYQEALTEFDWVLSRDPGFRDTPELRQVCAGKIKS